MGDKMKKVSYFVLVTVLMMSFTSCVSLFIGNGNTVLDHGHYYCKGEKPAAETANIKVDENLVITGIDDSATPGATYVKGWKGKKSTTQIQKFQLNPGVHTIGIKYVSDSTSANRSSVFLAFFEANKEYLVTSKIQGLFVIYDIINAETNESVVLDQNKLNGNSSNPISQFINAVLNPTMEGSAKTVYEENDEYKITYLPDMKYELYNKKTGKTEKGFRGFETDFFFKKGTVYLHCTDAISTKDDFLKSDYKNSSQIIWEVTSCDQKTVTYTYVKPENMAGKKITFNISQEK